MTRILLIVRHFLLYTVNWFSCYFLKDVHYWTIILLYNKTLHNPTFLAYSMSDYPGTTEDCFSSDRCSVGYYGKEAIIGYCWTLLGLGLA